MSRRGPTRHNGRSHLKDLEEGFIYNPLNGRSDSDEESETSSFRESTHSKEEEVSQY